MGSRAQAVQAMLISPKKNEENKTRIRVSELSIGFNLFESLIGQSQ
jgi:hypothetical protein